VDGWLSMGVHHVLQQVWRAESHCLLLIVWNVVAGGGLRRVWVRYLTAFVAASADDKWGIFVSCGKIFHRARNSFITCFRDVGAVVIWGMANVPAFEPMRCPGVLVIRCLVEKYLCTGRSEGGDV